MSLPVTEIRPRGLKATLARFHTSEQGDEGVNKILIIALVVVPLVIVLIVFGSKIKAWFQTAWNNITGSKDSNVDNTDPLKDK